MEVGTQGILGGQAKVDGVQGTWADLTRNVNVSAFRPDPVPRYVLTAFLQKMASNLTDQVRSISEVTKAVVCGDLGKVVDVDVQDEMLDLKPYSQLHGGTTEHSRERSHPCVLGSRN